MSGEANPTPRPGFIESGVFVPLPAGPILAAGLTPPCSVTLWDGRVRHIIMEGADG